MLKLQIPKNRINYLIERMQHDFDLAALETGWEFFHKGRVRDVELLDGVEVHADVRGKQTYKVTIDLDSFAKSNCSCSLGACCKHMAATIYALYASYARPELLLQQLRQAKLVKKRQQSARTTATAARTEKKLDRLEPPKPDQPPAAWQRYFDQQFYGYALTQQNSIELFYNAVKDSLMPIAADWDEPLRSLYTLHVLLFVMRKIDQFYADTKSSYLSYYIETGSKTVAKQCMERFAELLPALNFAELLEEHERALNETTALVGEFALDGKESPVEWLLVYRSIWWRLENQRQRVEQERKRLELLRANETLMPRKRDALLIALAHFDVMQGDDQKAMSLLEQLSRREAKDFFLYLHRCYELQQWNRMLAWLRWLLPSVQRAQQEELRTFCTYWMEAVGHQPDDGEWVDVMIALLPRTYYFYTSYLMKAQRYKSWVDLQISNRVSPLNLYAMDLKAVESSDPALLLPLYTQAVERCINEKNRNAYKTAVKLLKKLHSYYKKLDKENAWEEYIYRLATRYSRLRALQEELRKGKWIP
ncbi:SWIM zinc finger family protein [Paenibacillus xerothermodurans]|uniref:SWIM zinc finger family protein n=1 Tax=Paenibacillus xerothermodurans TaxID=1977292 RepID=A0A2W1N8Y4_PAEXE|nr:SWIM zinc finger family protein [Paenibacillus xerothermodurans]PZE20120.1 SWIM zinc finger family protein [Paenibacillus xerothermodurans]